jgi:hypothetical protein
MFRRCVFRVFFIACAFRTLDIYRKQRLSVCEVHTYGTKAALFTSAAGSLAGVLGTAKQNDCSFKLV